MERKTKILFINPQQSMKIDSPYSTLKMPLGFLYMGGILEKNNFEVKILDCPLYYQYREMINEERVKIGLPIDKTLEKIREFSPDIIGVSCAFTMYEKDSFELIDSIKKEFRDIFLVVGGAHSSANPTYVLRNKNIDLIVIGEGEITMLEVAKKFRQKKNLKNIKGTAFRVSVKGGKNQKEEEKIKIKINPQREFIQNLDEVQAAWHLINPEEYFQHPDNSRATMRKNSVDIVTSRGCPANCVFCSIKTVWGRKWRARSAKNVVDELEFLCNKYGAKQFRFQDDNLTLNKQRILDICNEIINRKLDIRWDTPNGIALWALDEEILTKMKQAGCYRVTLGVESGCKQTQLYIGKVIDLDYIKKMVNFCHKIGIWVCATFIIGFPYEKIEDIEQTEKFIMESKVNFPFVYIAQPYQGTRMSEDFKKEGLMEKDFVELSHIGNTKYNTIYLKSEEINKKLVSIIRKFYIKKIISYINPFIFYREFFSKIKSKEDLAYVTKMFDTLLFNQN